jgi:hypothetical protein
MTRSILSIRLFIIFVLLVNSKLISQSQKDIVHGNLIQFNDNGLWCWFQDERAIVDIAKEKIIVGSSACQTGFGGSTRAGLNEAVIFDIKSQRSIRYNLGKLSSDDHNAPAFLVRPDGKYITMYSDHYDQYKNRYRIFDGNSWTPEQSFDWTKRPGGTNYTIAYNNLYYLSAEGRMYNFSRANNRSPNFIVSDNMGDTWTFGGQLTTNSSNSYNKGYYKYWGNGVDRIDFIFTEQHPRDTLTSIYHGYIKNGKAYKSDGTLVDENIFDETFISAYWHFTKVFSNGTTIGNRTLYRCWQSDLVRYDNGVIAAIITARANQFESPGYPDNSINPDHDFLYCRYDGQNWSYTYLGRAGYKFYSSEADYVGLGALCPNDPNTLYISSPYDPRDNVTDLGVREIFKGVTSDNGVTWTWTPVTQNSTRDNIRPIVPAWNNYNMILLWCRGSYITAQSFDAAVVGIIESKNETPSKMNYVDATLLNTTFADGSPLVFTGPDNGSGAYDNRWHQRSGVGNGGFVFTSSETSGENAPALKTKIKFPKKGIYDVWVNFWCNPSYDWRIKAGLSQDNLQVFRSMACKQVENNSHQVPVLLSGSDNTFLYQAYLGRVEKNEGDELDVFIDDEATRTGSTTLTGDLTRTWYDGISYAIINDNLPSNINHEIEIPLTFALSQNYPNPFNPTTTINYTLGQSGNVRIIIYNLQGEEVKTLVNSYQERGNYLIMWDATDNNNSPVSSGVYFYSLKSGSYLQNKKMVLIR